MKNSALIAILLLSFAAESAHSATEGESRNRCDYENHECKDFRAYFQNSFEQCQKDGARNPRNCAIDATSGYYEDCYDGFVEKCGLPR